MLLSITIKILNENTTLLQEPNEPLQETNGQC